MAGRSWQGRVRVWVWVRGCAAQCSAVQRKPASPHGLPPPPPCMASACADGPERRAPRGGHQKRPGGRLQRQEPLHRCAGHWRCVGGREGVGKGGEGEGGYSVGPGSMLAPPPPPRPCCHPTVPLPALRAPPPSHPLTPIHPWCSRLIHRGDRPARGARGGGAAPVVRRRLRSWIYGAAAAAVPPQHSAAQHKYAALLARGHHGCPWLAGL